MGIFENLGIDIAGIVNDEIGPSMLAATLTVVTPGTRTVGDLAAGTNPTETTYACRGFVQKVETVRDAGGLVETTIRTVCLLGRSISSGGVVPKAGDKVTIESVEGRIVGVPDRDPAKAVYVCRVSG